ncbi:MAG: SIMPL domain-containing protein [Pseudomonadota bacterium]
MDTFTPRLIAAAAIFATLTLPAGAAEGQEPKRIEREIRIERANANSIQPETTLSISATGTVVREPDIAHISAGVETEAETAANALAENAERMTGVFEALERAGVEKRDIQTSNFNISPKYNYPRDRAPRLSGYTATNTVTARITDLEALGETIDALVEAGGNTLNGITFGLEDDSEARDEARRLAMEAALARAELYAEAAGYRVARIVSIAEGGAPPPMPLMMARAEAGVSAASPIAAGELDLRADVTVLFELVRED